MQLLFRKLIIFVIAAGLVLSGATSHAGATMLAGAGKTAPHEASPIQHYADLAIEPGDPDCPQMTADSPVQHSHDNGLCKKCCAACMSVSLIPNAPFPMLMFSETRETFSFYRSALVAYTAPIDPGIPKPL